LRHLLLRSIALSGLLVAGGMAVEQPQSISTESTDQVQNDYDISDALVKIEVVSTAYNYSAPWSMQPPRRGNGSGSVIPGKLIMTNAHVVSDASFIQVRRSGDPRRWRAQVVHVVHDADLAFLRVADEEAFFAGITPLELGTLPPTLSDVRVYGYPMGGDGLSVTKGVVSRVETRRYAHSGMNLLAGQIDAAINPGNSGGPVIRDGKIVGVVMQGIPGADNIGYMVPEPVIRHVLEDLDDGEINGFPSVGVVIQGLQNPTLKQSLQMPVDATGSLVVRVIPGSASDGVLQAGDVILTCDGQDIADDMSVQLRGRERVHWSYLAQKRQIGDALPLTILRDGQTMDISLTLTTNTHDHLRVPLPAHETEPQWFVYGGLVFTELSMNLLQTYNRNSRPQDLVNLARINERDKDSDAVVVLLRVLPAEVNKGYHGMANWVLDSVDGERVRSVAHLIELVEAADGDFVTFMDARGHRMVLDRAGAAAATAGILRRYRIDRDRSLALSQGQ
jgi:S1-C subfamily serine protease